MVIGQLLGGPEVLSHLRGISEEAQKVLKSEVRSLAVMLAGYVKTDKLTGEVLHVRSGRLRRSITFRVQEDGSLVTGIVGTNVEYARAHEFGVDMFKAVTVREYLRKTKASWREAGKIGWRGKNRLAIARDASMGGVVVHSFTRNQHIKLPERSFLRSALADLTPEIRQGLEAAVRKAVGK